MNVGSQTVIQVVHSQVLHGSQGMSGLVNSTRSRTAPPMHGMLSSAALHWPGHSQTWRCTLAKRATKHYALCFRLPGTWSGCRAPIQAAPGQLLTCTAPCPSPGSGNFTEYLVGSSTRVGRMRVVNPGRCSASTPTLRSTDTATGPGMPGASTCLRCSTSTSAILLAASVRAVASGSTARRMGARPAGFVQTHKVGCVAWRQYPLT
jgi:hypothetical protein